jgi:hypothetical protein
MGSSKKQTTVVVVSMTPDSLHYHRKEVSVDQRSRRQWNLSGAIGSFIASMMARILG